MSFKPNFDITKIKTSNINTHRGIIATGTHMDKCEAIFGKLNPADVLYIKRDYILDILNKRPQAVGINWYCLINSEMVKAFGYTEAEMENFTDLMTVENNKLKGELWVRDVINFLFNKQLPIINKETRKYRNHNLINDAATMIFTAGTKETHRALKALLETLLPGYLIRIIDGDETTNAKAEDMARQAVRDQYNTYGNYNVIFIASGMANRSFSVPEIKNIILFTNAGDTDQKNARGLTYWKANSTVKCNIIDFRLSYATETNLSVYLSNIAVESLEENATHKSTQQLVDEIEATDKLSFFEYFSAGADPLRELTADEISTQMHSRDYLTARATKVVLTGIDTVDMPDSKFKELKEKLDLNGLASSNVKGDSTKKVYANRAISNAASGKSEKELAEDQRIHYLAYLLNHKEVFNSYNYEEDILKNEFTHNMSAERKAAYETYFDIDMHVMCQIAELLISNNIKIYN